MQALIQKYPSAYYAKGRDGEHYVMYEGIRTRHNSEDNALEVCEDINVGACLPHINVNRSKSFNER